MTFFFFFFFFFCITAASGAATAVGGGSKRRPAGRALVTSAGVLGRVGLRFGSGRGDDRRRGRFRGILEFGIWILDFVGRYRGRFIRLSCGTRLLHGTDY